MECFTLSKQLIRAGNRHVPVIVVTSTIMLRSECACQIIIITTGLLVDNAKGGSNDNKITGPLEIGVIGVKPFFFYDGSIRGSDILILQLLSKKLGFKYNLTMVNSFDIVVKMVRPIAWAKCTIFI